MFKWIVEKLSDLLYWMDNSMTRNDAYYEYKGNVYHTWGVTKDNLEKVKDPTTGEWFDAVRYRPIRMLTDKEGKEYFTHVYDEVYMREVKDFKKKFKKVKMDGKKEI